MFITFHLSFVLRLKLHEKKILLAYLSYCTVPAGPKIKEERFMLGTFG